MGCLTYDNISFNSEQEFKDYVEANPEQFSKYLDVHPGEAEGTAINYAAEARPQAYDSSLGGVDYAIKAANILASEKAIHIFKAADKGGWSLEKILVELQVPAAQRELLKSFGTRNRAELLTSLLANYSYTVEINTAKKPHFKDYGEGSHFKLDDLEYEHDRYTNTYWYTENGIQHSVTLEQYLEAKNQLPGERINSDHYSNMTVPGGTNYTENEIRTPDITPSIKGHAQFSTDQGIGWFRSDDKAFISSDKNFYRQYLKEKDITGEYEDVVYTDDFQQWVKSKQKEAKEKEDSQVKTRRILEIQSDLFQKGRNAPVLTNDIDPRRFRWNGFNYEELYEGGQMFLMKGQKEVTKEEFNDAFADYLDHYTEKSDNQFLQLINKDNNWVSFFVKSIVQDSAKKGYEKILFPTGDTAAKVEGHQTLEIFIKEKQYRVNLLKEGIDYDQKLQVVEEEDTKGKYYRIYDPSNDSFKNGTHLSKEVAQKNIHQRIEDRKREISRLEDEIKQAEGGNLRISSIAKFYEDTIKNILDKRGYKPERIKDEHGNEWYQVNLKQEDKETIILESSLSDLAEGLKEASNNQKVFEGQIERLIKEAANIEKAVNRVDDETLRTRLRDALRYVKDPLKKADLKNFVYLILETSEVLKHYVSQLKKLPELTDIDQRVALIEKAKVVSTSFGNLIKFLKKDFRFVNDTNGFKQLVNQLSDNYDQIQTIYAAEAELASIAALGAELEPDVRIALGKLEGELAKINKEIARAQKAGASEKFINGLTNKANTVKKQILTLVPNAETLEETFKGLRGDLNWFTGNFRSAVAMGDPIISGYARRLKHGFNKVRQALFPIREEAQTQLENYMRSLGVRPSQSMGKFYEGLYRVQELSHEKEGKVETDSFYSLLAPVHQAFFNEDLVHKNKIRDLKDKGADKAEVEVAEQEYLKWLNQYAERRYSEAWYDRYNLLTPEAAEARQEIIDEINNILRGPNRDTLTDADIDRLGELKYKQKRLASLHDEDGKLKTGARLEISKSIQAFNKKTAEMSGWETTEENRRWFNIILSKKKEQLGAGLISQQDYDRWFSANTQRNISPEFYKARQVIIDKIQSIMSKLPKDHFKDDMKVLWTSILDVSRPYRDEDNILEGTEVKPDEAAVVRSSEEKIEELKAKVIRFSGLTLEEERELAGLWGNLDTLDDQEIARFMSLREQKESYQKYLAQYISQLELTQLLNAFGELADISKWVTTPYYKNLYDQKLHEFRTSVDPGYLQELTYIEEKFKHESNWYKDNHITKTKKVYTEESNQVQFIEQDEPLYIWKDIIPTNEKWVEEDAPGFNFKTRIVKPDFINSRYGQLNYEFFKTTDPDEYRTVPKRFVREGANVVKSKFINKDYDKLREDARDSTQAKAKWDMLQFLIKTHLEGQQKLPQYRRLGYFLPGVMKTTYDRALETGVKGLKDDFMNKWVKVTQEDKDLTLGDTSQIELSIIPIKHSTKVAPDDQDLNLLEGVLKHRASVEEYSYLDSELPTANVIQSALRTSQEDIPQSQIDTVLERMGFSKFIRGTKESTRSKTFDQFVRTMFYGEMEVPVFGNAHYNKWINNLFGLASLQVMTFNFPAHITNLLSGEIQNVIETHGGKYMKWGDYLKAKAIYSANVHNFWQDYGREGKKTFWSALADRLDVPQGEFMDHFGRKTKFSRLRTLKSHVMIIKSGGEHEMQISTMMAMSLNKKVRLDGNLVSLNEALELRNNQIAIKAGVTNPDGTDFTSKDLDSFQDKVQSVVRALNGAYAKIDRTVAEKSFLGKLAFFLRKYLIPMVYRRYETFKYDYEEQDFKEGYYKTAWNIIKDIAKLNTDVVKNWNIYTSSLTQEEKVNMRRFFSEIMIIGALALAIYAVGGYDRDRQLKGRWGYTMGLYQLLKMKSEAETFVPVPGLGFDEMSSLFSSPFVPAATVKNIARMGKDAALTVFGQPGARFQRDYGVFSEGDLRLKADVLKMLGINSNLATPENLIKNFELRNR